MTCARSYAWFLNLLSNGGLDCFSRPNCDLRKPVKIKTKKVNLDLPKVSKMTIIFELLKVSKTTSLKINISSHGEARNTKSEININNPELIN